MTLLTSKDIQTIGWKVKTIDFTTIEFSTRENVESSEGYEFDLHRIFFNENGTIDICIANTEDYDVHEEITELFDVDEIASFILSHISILDNVTKAYNEFYENYNE